MYASVDFTISSTNYCTIIDLNLPEFYSTSLSMYRHNIFWLLKILHSKETVSCSSTSLIHSCTSGKKETELPYELRPLRNNVG